MSTEYEKQLEKRCEELETQVQAVNTELSDYKSGKVKAKDLTLRFDDWTLTNVMHAHVIADSVYTKELVVIATRERMVSHFFKPPTKSVITNEYAYWLGQSVTYLNKHGNVPQNEKDMVWSFIKKCLSLGIIADKWEKNERYLRIDPEKLKERLLI